MNSQRYRIVFNKARGLLMVVGDLARRGGKQPRGRQVDGAVQCSCRLNPWSWTWLVLFGTVNVIGSAQAGIQADARSPGNEQPIIIGSANGTPLINIQTPSEGGVSRNSYRQFDVDGRGAILNNSRQDISTQLGGMVQGNPMLAGGEARIILNEVHSRDPSLLKGHIEVAGQRAQVVIANPAGISCSGCGFINAYRATLTTGQALMAEGRLTGYDVDRGEIVIQGTGLSNGDGQNYTDIIARSLSVNAELNASDLAITLGRNRVDADNRRFEKKSADDSAPPRLALDVASLGGMYAQQIRLIGTEDGVGVHNAGTVGAQAGAVVITTDGRIENGGRVGGKTDLALTSSLDIDNRGGLQIEGNATLKAGNAIYNSGSLHVLGNASLTAGNGIDNSGTLQAEGNASLKNGGAFHNSGTVSSRHDLHIQGGQLTSEPGSILAAGIQQNGNQVKEGNLTLDAQGQLRAQGQNLAAGDLVFHGQGVDVTQGRTAARNIKLDAGEGDLLTGGGATITARQQFTGHSASVFNNDGGSLSADRFAIIAADLSNQQGQISQWGEDNLLFSLPGTLNNRGGHIASNGGDLTLNASHINNHSGHINHAAAGTLTFTSEILDNGDGKIAGNSHDMTLNVTKINNDNGQITHTSTGDLKIAGDSLQSQKGLINSNGRLTMTARGHALLDRGRIAAPQVTLTVGTLSSRDGQINATGIGQQPATPGPRQLKVTVAEGLDNQRGHLTADGNVLLTAGSLNNQAGNLNANGDLRLDTGDLNNASGHITALQQGTLDLQVRGLLDNQHGAIAAENITLHAGSQAVNNAAGTLAAGHDLTLQSFGLNNDSGLLQAGNTMSMDLGEGRLSNRASGEKGGILSLGRLSIHSGRLDNQHGFIGARDDAAVATEDLHNAHGTLVSDGVLHLQTAALDNHSGVLQSGSDLTVQTQAQTLDNNSGWINASGALTLLTGSLLNQSGQLHSAGDLLLDTHGHDLDNRQGDIASAGRAAFTVARLNNAQGQVRAVGDARVNAGQGRVDNTAGAIRSGAAVTISADSIINRDSHIDNGVPRDANAGITGLEGQSVILRSAELDNRRGIIRANQLLEITAGRELANAHGLLSSAQVLKVQGETALRIGNNSGTLVAGKQLDLSAGALSGDGRVLSQDAMALSLQPPFFNTGEVTANGDMQLTLAQGLENSQRITAGGELNLHTASLTNHESGEISAAQNHLLVDGTLTNHGLLDGTLTHIVAANLTNIGSGRLYGDHIALSTGTLDNLDENGQAATVAARERLDLGVHTLNNRSQGHIYSAGSLAIGGGLNEAFQAEGRAKLFTNHRATLESAEDMSLNIDRIVNANDTLVTGNQVTERSPHHDAVLQGYTQRFEWADIDKSYENDYGVHDAIMPDGTRHNKFYEYDYLRTVTETQIVQSEPAKILAGGNLTINSDQVRNSDSQILAGGLLGGTINQLQNLATPGERTIKDLGQQIYWYAKKSGGGIGGTKTSQGKKTSRYQPAAVVQTIDLKAMAYQGSAAVDGSGTRLEPRKTTALTESVGNPDGPAVQLDKRPIDAPTVQTVEIVQPLDPLTSQQVAPVVRTASPDIHLPVSSLFQLHPDFTSQYLVETDPRFTNRKQWLGSDYMQQAINHDAGHMLKRLGDGYYEQQVIRNQVINLTGQRYLSGFNNDSDQFKALMDAGIAFGKRYSLTPGVALTPEQMALLTSNMVWLVKQDVILPDGSVQSVVAPQLYARLQQGDLDGSGALLSGNHVGLDIQQDLTNSGTILGREVTRLSADNLTNSGFIGGQRTDLTARTDMVNRGGTLSGGDSLTVRADRDIISQSTLRGDEEHRAIDRPAGLYVQNDGGTLALKALHNITLTATQASTLGADSKLNIAAGKTLTLDTLTQTHTENSDWSQDTYRHLSQHDDVGSQLNSQGSIALHAGHDLNAKAASVTAAGALTAEAGHDITLAGGQSGFTLTEHDKQNRRNMLSATSQESHDQVTEQNNLGSNFSGNSQDIKAGHDLLVTGSSVAGTEDVSLTAGHRLAIETSDQTRLDQHWNVAKTSGLTGTGGLGFNYGSNSLKISDDGTVHSSAGSTVGSTEGTVRLEAGQGLKIKGSDVLARKDIALKGQQVAIGHADNHSVQTHRVDQMQSGLTLALSGLVGGIANTAVTTINQAGTQSNGRLAALDGIKSALNGVQAYQGYAMEQAKGEDGTLIGLNLSYGAQSSTSKQTQTRHQSQGSQLTAGNNLQIEATQADITVQGSQLQAGNDLGLTALTDVKLLSASDTSVLDGTNASLGGSLGIGFNIGRGKMGLTLNASVNMGRGSQQGEGETHTLSTANAGHGLNIVSGQNTRLTGAQVSADRVTVAAGHDLLLASEQDHDDYHSRQVAISASGSIGIGSASASATFSRDAMNSTYAAVKEQTGVYAGQGGNDVKVGGLTALNGAVIGSTATADRNRLDTGTLSFAAIENRAKYNVEHQSVTVGGSNEGNLLSTVLAGLNGHGSASSTTRSAVSDGSLTVRDGDKQQQDVSKLSRDVAHAHQTLSPIFNKEQEQQRLQAAKKIGDIATQVSGIIEMQGKIAAAKVGTAKADTASAEERSAARSQWEQDHKGKTATQADIHDQLFATAYNAALVAAELGTGGEFKRAAQSAIAVVQGLATGNIAQAIAGGSAPYIANIIKKTTPAGPERVMAHAVVGAVVAQLSGGNALAGASGAAMGEYIASQVYAGTQAKDLTESQKTMVSALGTLAAGLAGGLAGGDVASAVAGAQAGKNAVENNWLSVKEAERKYVLESKDKAGAITPDEKNELAAINETDKDRDQAIKAVCTDGNKGGSGCGALVGPAEEALKKYGENITYSLLYKHLYPQDARNLERVLQGLDKGSIGRDQAITAIAQASGVSWETAASRYDTAMQTQALTAALAGAVGLKGVIEKPAGVGTIKQPSESGRSPAPVAGNLAVDEEAGAWSQYDKYRRDPYNWNWPKKLGFAEEPVKTTLPVGTRLDRYGEPAGSFLAPKGTPYGKRALAPGAKAEKYYEYEVVKPLPVMQGKIAPAFGETGGGVQILPNMEQRVNIEWLIDKGYLKEIK